MVKQLPDAAPFAMMGFEFAMAIAIALFLIASATGNFLSLPSALAAVILSLLCLPVIVMLYWSEDDAALRKTFRGLIVYFVIQTISGVTWYLLSMAISDPVIVDLAMLLMVVGYVPLLAALYATIRMQWLDVRPVFRYLMVAAGIFSVMAFAALVAVRVLTDPGNAYPASIFAASIVADLLIVAMCSILIIRNIGNSRRTIFAILLATFIVSLTGDSLNLVSAVGLYDGANLAQFFYAVTLILITVALLLYSLTTVNVALLNRVNRELYDTRRLVGDILLYTPDAMCIAGPDGNMISANGQFEDLIGRDGRKGGRRFNIFEDCSLLGDAACGLVNELRQGRPAIARGVRFPGNEGVTGKSYVVKMFPAFASVGDTVRYVVIVEDITELKAAEEALKHARDDLETRVMERTLELAVANEKLHAEIAERRAAEGKIRASLLEKEVLLKEVHHRVKNNLQIISSLFGIQAYTVRDEICRNVLRESQDRIRSIAMIHEKLYQTPDIAMIDFAQYVQSLADNLYRSYGADSSRITMATNVDNAKFDIDTAIPCGLIINELVSNSLKYAFPENRHGIINIRLWQENDRYVLEVSDNGVGLPGDLDVHNVSSMGLQLVDILAEQLGGRMTVGRTSGTCFQIAFSVDHDKTGI